MRLGSTMPNFYANTTHGPIQFYDWLGDAWCVLFSHPADFTPVCTSELSRIAEKAYEFTRRGVRLLGHSCDSLEDHKAWVKDIRSYSSRIPVEFPYPIIADERRELAVRLDMIDESDIYNPEAALTVRALYIIGPDRKVKMAMFYPNSTGRSVDEILRVVDSLQLVNKVKVVTPVDWKMGDEVMVEPDVPQAALPKLFPRGVETIKMPSGMAYVRTTSDYLHSSECWDGLLM
ncbi:peroxiredoxin-6 [Anabrus simplex]|uniref:peroxiredoxin-6 n=1 Tax=Anabrus simplex TaxID=316456 RepID=UPI0034DCEEDE